ncbi:MAG: hypothetical protein DMF84_12130 [Acidobacteria bacterium]|nr:MAG: hypothetical protein DMF84_12130 [Acidobacteriota bacterium]
MRRGSIIALLVAVPLALLIAWVASHTDWVDTKVPMPPKGEALINPFYAAQRFAEALAARTAWDRLLAVPSTDSVIVLSDWHWTLSRTRREALERWVESGGRLVLEGTLTGGKDEFEHWSQIVCRVRTMTEAQLSQEVWRKDACASFQEEHDGIAASGADRMDYSVCDFDSLSSLTSNKRAEWALRNATGVQAMRVHVGRGSITVINATPFRQRHLFDGDHGRLFVAATGLRRGDDVHFLSEADQPSLLALVWAHGAPVVALVLTLVALALWRGGVRFGPLAPAPHAARRSLAEQIRGTGQFALRHGDGRSLHAACLRALEEAAQRRVKSYTRLEPNQRISTLAHLTGFDRQALAAAIGHTDSPGRHDLRRSLALLEAARRETLIEHRRSSHGTR